MDYSIHCDSNEHAAYKLYAYLMIFVYPIGIPMLYYRLLRDVADKLDPGQREFTLELKSEDAGQEKALEEREKLEESDPRLKALSFLYGAYEPRCYWFEVFETLRKLALTGGLVFLRPGTASQIMMSMILCLGSMRVYAGYKPFIEDKVDTFAEVAQWQLFFTMFAALSIKVNVDDESLQDRSSFDVMLVILQFIAPLIVVVHYFVFEAKDDVTRVKRNLSDANEGRDRASSSVYDIFSELRKSLGWDKDEPLAIGDGQENGIELGSIYSDDGGIRKSNNPMHRPSAAPSPPFMHTDEVGVEKSKQKSLPPQIARSASGGFQNSKTLGTKEKKRENKRAGLNSESWKLPAEGVIIADGKAAKTESNAENRWSAHYDETQGCHYYYDSKTHQTTWEKPEDFQEVEKSNSSCLRARREGSG